MSRGAQLDLFACPPSARDPELVSLASLIPPSVRFGTSSWAFPGWKGLVYREAYRNEKDLTQRSLEEYARHPLFRTVSVDRAYYAPMTADVLRAHAAQVPASFRFVVKAWSELVSPVFPKHPRYGERAGQQNARFLDPGLFRECVAEPIREGLGEKAGPVVLSLPPTRGPGWDAGRFERALRRFLEAAPPGLDYAVELRDRRLFTPRYFGALADFGATHVFNHWSGVPSLAEQLAMPGSLLGPRVVARLMLPPGGDYDALKRAYSPFDRIVRPDPAMKKDTIALVRAAIDLGHEVFVIVNNKAEGSAPLTVRALAESFVGPPAGAREP